MQELEMVEEASYKKRITIWAFIVISIVGFLSLHNVFSADRTISFWQVQSPAGTLLAIFLAALVCEYIDSSLGMGYGTALTPLLILFSFDPKQIVPAVLLSEFITGLFAGMLHHKDGNIDFFKDKQARTTALLLSCLSAVGAILAVSIAVNVPKNILSGFISVIIIGAGILILATIKRQFKYRKSHIIALGTLAAFNKGLSGGGYGPLVTAGQVVSGVSPKSAVAITSLAESFTCLVGVSAYLATGRRIDWSLAVPLICGAVLSVPMATITIKKIPESYVKALVGITTLILGVIASIKLFS